MVGGSVEPCGQLAKSRKGFGRVVPIVMERVVSEALAFGKALPQLANLAVASRALVHWAALG